MYTNRAASTTPATLMLRSRLAGVSDVVPGVVVGNASSQPRATISNPA